ILFFSDRFWESPGWWRALLLVSTMAICALAAFQWCVRWIFRRRDWRALSVIVQKRFRRLGDRLLGIVELSSESKHDANFSPELYRAAIHQVADETTGIDFRHAVQTGRAKKIIAATVALGGSIVIFCAIVPALGKNVLHRWVAPWSSVPRYTLVQIADLPAELVVPHGEDFRVDATVVYRSFWKPNHATAKISSQTAVSQQVKGNKITFPIPAQTQSGKLRIKVGDAAREVVLVPTYRPALKQLDATIQLPAYLQASNASERVNNGILNLLEGSTFSLRGKASRDLAAAEIAGNGFAAPLKTERDEFSSGLLTNSAILQYNFLWRDQLGLSNATVWKLTVRPQKDLPALPVLPDLPSDVAILDSDVLEIRAVGKDDFGVSDLGLNWELASDSAAPIKNMTTEVKIQPRSPHEKQLEKVFRWSPAVYRIPEDSSVEIASFANDYFPERERSASSTHRIHVLGKEKHAELVRQKLESLLARVEEVARLEEKVKANTSDLAENQKLTEAEKGERIGKVKEEQERNAKNLEQLAQEGMKALQEGLKNPVFTEQALQEWAKNLEQMMKLSQKQMKAAGESLKSAQKNPSAEARKKDLAEAEKQEKEVLEALEKMQGKVNQDLDDLQALTLAERLRKVGAQESEISAALQKIVPETIGMLPKEMPEALRKAALTLANQQDGAHTESHQLQSEINRFFERTQKKNYGEVSKEITESKTSEELERVGGLIKENVAMEATRNLGEWADRFARWADKLEPPKEESGEGKGNSKSGESPKDMTKSLVALLRLREKEMTLREQTQLLDEQRGDEANYKDRASGLSGTQKKLGEDLGKLAQENDLPPLVTPFQQTGEAMSEAELLLQRPQTDQATVTTQVKSIDLLTDLINLINEQAKRQNSPQSQPQKGEGESEAEQMAFLMQMMSPGKKPGEAMSMKPGGGNRSGGSTERAGEGSSGEVAGKSGPERKVDKASGSAGTSVPTEFRETLESYFKAIEQEPN
ncbi:MAG: hypothetical protein ABIQ35_03120, partial [Verrucomicrobiota bacterium]